MAIRKPGRARRKTDTNPVWVVSVDYRGQQLRWVSREVTWVVDDEDGGPVAFEGAWNPPDAINLSEDVSVAVEVIFPDGSNLAAGELAGTVTLSRCPVEVAWLPTGGAWADRHVVLQGVVAGPEIGGDGEPVAFGIEPWSRSEDTALVPDPTRAVSREFPAWPLSPDSSQGLSYPIVYGAPGVYKVGEMTLFADGSPAVVVESATSTAGDTETIKASTLLIAWEMPPDTTQVRLRWSPAGADGDWVHHTKTIEETSDPYSQIVPTLDISAFADADRQAGGYFIAWEFGPATATDRASDIALWWLQRSSVQVDLIRSQAGLQSIHGLKMGGYVNTPTAPLAWVADRLGDFPVKLVDGPLGAYLAPIRWEAQASEAVAAIRVVHATSSAVASDGAVRVSPLRVEGGQATEVRASWALDCASGNYKMLTVLSSSGDSRTTKAQRSAQLGGGSSPRSVKVDFPDVWDESTATTLARFLAWREGAARRTVRVAVPTDGFAYLIVGDVVLYTDETLGLADVVAYIDNIGLTTAAMTELELVLVKRQ